MTDMRVVVTARGSGRFPPSVVIQDLKLSGAEAHSLLRWMQSRSLGDRADLLEVALAEGFQGRAGVYSLNMIRGSLKLHNMYLMFRRRRLESKKRKVLI